MILSVFDGVVKSDLDTVSEIYHLKSLIIAVILRKPFLTFEYDFWSKYITEYYMLYMTYNAYHIKHIICIISYYT